MELKIVHPLTAQWLTDHGYTYEYEVKMPEYGRADFVAKRSGEVLIVECKEKLGNETGRCLAQVVDYCRQYGQGARPAIAASHRYISRKVPQICNYYDALLIELDDKGEIEFQYFYRGLKYRFANKAGDYRRNCLYLKFRGKALDDSIPLLIQGQNVAIDATGEYIDKILPIMFQRTWAFEEARDTIARDMEESLGCRHELDWYYGAFDLYLSGFKSITETWWAHGISEPEDLVDLTGKVCEVAIGGKIPINGFETVVQREFHNDLSAIDSATIKFAECVAGLLHIHRESFGKPELSEDIDDVRPIIDAARPEIHKVFSQKPRRLPGAKKPRLSDH